MKLCQNCKSSPVATGRRKYCDPCGRRASALWKARHRREFREEWIASGKQGPPPWLDHWASAEAFKQYHRDYMRAWRAARRGFGVPSPRAIAASAAGARLPEEMRR